MSNFDVASPLDSDLIRQGDDEIRQLKQALQDALRGGDAEGVEAVFPGASPSTDPVFHYRGLKGSTVERPTAGQYGLYFDTTRQVLQRDNGTTWDDIGASFVAGTKTVFYQATAPVGWTAEAINDKFLRVVTSGTTGGSTGGTVAASTTLAHTHTLDHTHSISAHSHTLSNAISANTIHTGPNYSVVSSTNSGGGLLGIQSSSAGTSYQVLNSTETSGSGTTGSAGSVSGSTFSGSFAYADVIVASKN
jgi:hypothetical protein